MLIPDFCDVIQVSLFIISTIDILFSQILPLEENSKHDCWVGTVKQEGASSHEIMQEEGLILLRKEKKNQQITSFFSH
jgi:hypothetical protein